MTTPSKAIVAMVAGFAMTGIVVSGQQAGPASEPVPMAENVYKAVAVLRGIPVDEFIDTMGMFAAATAKDCTGCHHRDILDGKVEAFAIPTPMIQKARQMVTMMNAINATYFGGQKRVTCATCHSNSSAPENVPNMAIQYGEPLENPNSMQFAPASAATPAQIDQLFTKYIDAIGGAQRLAAVTGYTATGTYAGWDTGLSEVPVEVFAKAPGKMSTVAHRTEGNSVWAYDGRNAWRVAVNAAITSTIPLTGGNLTDMRMEALVALNPAGIKAAFGKWEFARGIIDADRAVQILRGTNQGQPPVNFYFDNTGLLVRMMLWADTLVGPVATQYDYSEYREVGGVRRPHRIVKTSTINQVTMVLKQMQPNAAIDDARFAKPTTTRLIK